VSGAVQHAQPLLERSLVQKASVYLELVRPRVAAMVVYTALIGALVASGPGTSILPSLEAAFYIALTAAGASAFNQVYEREIDGLMVRTRTRPLPTGRLRARDALAFSALLAVAGVGGLAMRYGTLSALLSLATLSGYCLLYTPLKRLSSWNTLVGALPGAMPPLIGFVAISGELSGWGVLLFAILFAWQFPHFFAIAWLHREDYERAGMRMLPALPGFEALAARQGLAYAVIGLLISLFPVLRGEAGLCYLSAALVLGCAYVWCAFAFARRVEYATARRLLLCSLFHLPLLFTAVLLDPLAQRALGI